MVLQRHKILSPLCGDMHNFDDYQTAKGTAATLEASKCREADRDSVAAGWQLPHREGTGLHWRCKAAGLEGVPGCQQTQGDFLGSLPPLPPPWCPSVVWHCCMSVGLDPAWLWEDGTDCHNGKSGVRHWIATPLVCRSSVLRSSQWSSTSCPERLILRASPHQHGFEICWRIRQGETLKEGVMKKVSRNVPASC